MPAACDSCNAPSNNNTLRRTADRTKLRRDTAQVLSLASFACDASNIPPLIVAQIVLVSAAQPPHQATHQQPHLEKRAPSANNARCQADGPYHTPPLCTRCVCTRSCICWWGSQHQAASWPHQSKYTRPQTGTSLRTSPATVGSGDKCRCVVQSKHTVIHTCSTLCCTGCTAGEQCSLSLTLCSSIVGTADTTESTWCCTTTTPTSSTRWSHPGRWV